MNKSIAQVLRTRAEGRCEYCISPEYFCPDPFEGEHIIPKVLGGATEFDNLAFACSGCNGCKYDCIETIDPATGLLALLFHPRRDVWAEHFRWNEDFTLIIGISPTRRATVQRLKLNRQGVVNLRRVLVASGDHPPVHHLFQN